jgi:hypothetical protein
MSADTLIAVSRDSHARLHPDSFPEYVGADDQHRLCGMYEDIDTHAIDALLAEDGVPVAAAR